MAVSSLSSYQNPRLPITAATAAGVVGMLIANPLAMVNFPSITRNASVSRAPTFSFLLVLMLLISRPCDAGASHQPLQDIQSQAEDAVRRQLPNDGLIHHLSADRLDERLRLPTCDSALQATLPYGLGQGSKTSVAVRCMGTSKWTLYVGVRIETESQAVVLTRSLPRGALITNEVFELRPQRIDGVGTTSVTNAKQLIGLRTKRDLAAGTTLTPAMLEPEVLIKRGQQVTLIAAVGGIEVRSQGEALTDGSANGRIRVRNLSSSKVVEGLVDNRSQVRVDL